MATIRQTVTLAYPVEMVWAALTNSDDLAKWLMPNDFRPEIGHRFTFRTDPAPGFDGIIRCELLHLDEPSRLSFTWCSGRLNTQVTFMLKPNSTGTELSLTHEGFGLTQLPVQLILGAGWKKLLTKNLPQQISTVAETA